ncbi:MAG: T9SS type A sorting domain-containing protein [Bacteroidota bacterium]
MATKTYYRKLQKYIYAACFFLTLSIRSNAATVTWTGGFLGLGTDWQTGSNWNTSSVPASTDDVVFNEVLLGYTVKLSAATTVKSITVNSALSLIGAVVINTNGNSLTVTNGLNLGAFSLLFPTALQISGSGAVTINSAVNLYPASYLNFASGSNVTLSSTNLTTYTSATLANDGTATVTASTFNISGSSSTLSNTGTFNVGPTSIINLTGATAGVTNSGTFTLQSTSAGSAAIGTIPSGTSGFSGQYAVQRYLSGGSTTSGSRYVYRGYRIMSSPVNAGLVGGQYPYTLNYIATNAIVSGAKSTYGTVGGNPTLYVYSEDYAVSNASFTGGNFKGITDISVLTSPYTVAITSNGTSKAMYVGNGFFFFFRGDNTHSLTGTPSKTSYPFVAPESVSFTATGNLNQGSYTVNNWQTGSGLLYTTVAGNATVIGFNMVGNPYASTIDWETINSGGIALTNVDPTAYVLNPVTNQYNTYSASTHTGNPVTFAGKIASGQGFFVKANNTGAAITFNETAKSASTVIGTGSGNMMMGTPLAQTKPQLLRLRLTIDSLNYDDIAIGFNSSASSKYSIWEDSAYLPSNAPEGLAALTTDSIPVALSVNFLPLPKLTSQIINLKVTATNSGRLTLEKTQLDSLPKIYEIWLMDKYKKDSLDIRHNATYAFDIDKSDTGSFGNNRFALVIRQNKSWDIHLLNFTASKAPAGAQLTWKTENEENYTNFTVERSTDNGATFNVLGGVASNSQENYTFTDANPANTVDMYRVKIEDLNGTITYTKTIAVTYNGGNLIAAGSNNNINIYPNPAVSAINLSIKQPVGENRNVSAINAEKITSPSQQVQEAYAISIISTSGQFVRSAVSSQPAWHGDISSLSPGTYVVQVLNSKDKSLVGRAAFVKL